MNKKRRGKCNNGGCRGVLEKEGVLLVVIAESCDDCAVNVLG